jgi:hypothetical protein
MARWRGLLLIGAVGAVVAMVPSAAAGATGNGIATQSAAQIVTTATNATIAAKSFTIVGYARSKGSTTGLHITATSRGDGEGTITLKGLPVQIVKVDSSVYFRAGRAFWTKNGGASAAGLLANRWVQFSAASSNFQSLAQFFSTTQIAQQFLGSTPKGAVFKKTGLKMVAGQQVIGVTGKDPTNGAVGYFDAATKGSPYVIRITSSDQGTVGSATFTNYNQAVHLEAPKGAVNITKLESGS